MRKRIQKGPLSLNAIAGTHVVMLGIDLLESACPGLLGFAIRRTDHTEGEQYWLRGYKTFASVEPNPAPGVQYSTRLHPIQGFGWSDFSAKPEHDYTYEVIALRGSPAQPEEHERVKVRVRTESEVASARAHHVHFNRGAAASQEYTRRFGDKRPSEVGAAAFRWLSRGAAEAITAFIARANDDEWGLRVSAYEFNDPGVLDALRVAWQERGVDVRVLYHARSDSTRNTSEKAIAATGVGAICAPRVATGITLSHHKFMVLTRKGKAQAVLTGSTNFSPGGIYGHSNVVHVCELNKVATAFLKLWDGLALNTPRSALAPLICAATPLPLDEAPGTLPIFSPRTDMSALKWYADKALASNQALFMTFAFGMHDLFQNAYRKSQAPLRYALMEEMSGPAAAEKRLENEKKIVSLRRLKANKFAIGGHLNAGAFGRWLNESLSGLNRNVKYLHTKYMLVDPLGDNPLVVTGSANFSEASTLNNDENMLIIQSERRVADIYLGEFMRLYRHFAFRDWLSSQPTGTKDHVTPSHLDETDQWWKAYFNDTFAARQRVYFAG